MKIVLIRRRFVRATDFVVNEGDYFIYLAPSLPLNPIQRIKTNSNEIKSLSAIFFFQQSCILILLLKEIQLNFSIWTICVEFFKKIITFKVLCGWFTISLTLQ